MTGKQKTIICDTLKDQIPEIYEMVIEKERDNKDIINQCIEQLYYDQIQFRYPEILGSHTSKASNASNASNVIKLPLLKCCLMNQSFFVEVVYNLTLDVIPIFR